jgi:hypothetical protein
MPNAGRDHPDTGMRLEVIQKQNPSPNGCRGPKADILQMAKKQLDIGPSTFYM